MRKPKTYFPVHLGFRISKELDEALWAAADSEALDRSKWLRKELEQLVFAKGIGLKHDSRRSKEG